MRYWLLTNTTYGVWLPGDERGSIASVRDRRVNEPCSPVRQRHNRPGEAYEPSPPGLRTASADRLKAGPILLTHAHADAILPQWQETARYRGWTLKAVAIMANHFHLVVAVCDDPEPRKVLVDFKAYASRRLNLTFGKPKSGTWWTKGGSKRKLPDQRAVASAIHYVLHKQPHPLLTWSPLTSDD